MIDTMDDNKRLVSLDVFRGLTIAFMIIVNDPGNWSYVYAPLKHSPWNGCTPTDMVFPFFMFIVGAAMWYSYKKYNHELTGKLVLENTETYLTDLSDRISYQLVFNVRALIFPIYGSWECCPVLLLHTRLLHL